MRLPCLIAASAAVLLSACSSTDDAGGFEPECSSSKPCANGEVCLEIGSCAEPCQDDADCGSAQKCSAGGGCVAQSGCGANPDCTGQGANTVCGTSGTCTEPCTATSCGSGSTCEASGRCSAPTTPGLPGIPGTPSTCGGELFGVTPVQANFLIVLDHSGSMEEEVGGVPKWESAVSALRALTQAHGAKVRFGLQLFSTAQQQCDPGQQVVAIGDNQAAAISSALPATADGNRTPIGAALQVASQNQGLVDAQRSNNILLITDGMENCGGNPVNEAGKLLAKGIKTYVLGFGGEVDPQMLSETATSGGTARVGSTKYYQADDPAALNAAMQAIAAGALGCDIQLGKAPPNPDKIFVYVDGNQMPRDTTKQNGWDYVQSGNRVVLYGATCSLVSANPSAKVQVVYGCPDSTLVEGGAGSPCTSDRQCASGECTAGVCVGAAGNKPNGSPCVSSSECASRSCQAGLCEGGGAGKPPGESCNTNTECASQFCNQGVCAPGIG